MTSTLAPAPGTATRRPTAARRFGYVIGIAVNAVMLWAAYQLLDWQWPRFLTDDFAHVLPLLAVSLVVGMVVNAGFLVRDRGRFRAAGDLVTAAFGMAVSARMLAVFPFDFAGYATDWSWLARVALVVGIVGTAIAVIVNVVKFITGDAGPTD